MDKTIKWGIIGCGDVTEVKSGPAYSLVNGFELVAVMRRRLELAKDYAQRHGVKTYYDDADALINDRNVDAVYIATPPDSHHFYALKVAKAGKICCIEKPMAPSYMECKEIYTAFADQNIPLFIAYYRRSLPRFDKVKSLIDNNAIGVIRYVNWNLARTASPADLSEDYNWRTDAKIAPAGYFDDLASHGLDLCIYLLGGIKEASGASLNQQQLYTAKDAISGSWLHDSGVIGSASWNFGAYKREDSVRIVGSEGELRFSVFGDEPIELITNTSQETFVIDQPNPIQLYHVDHMQKHLSGISQHPSTGESGLHTAWVMDKILGKL
ncbi:Gfo/Idh/MocA family protein [Winogradskyella psychrotolerans]|uniref:Gfo/Idh/MocA family protein n=1 Tax=Winogradskyella psychrotolerans TaxID=1344585 RepID=UPI001C06696B|nr:Gfo/Idh/MocA family oxidoreductase [Winogradskyella psychrotolerans]MBU2928009.1 Gfo/Idh/MocA family oxidoreductase [Winogradskyella psychrotolerans]